MIQCHHFFRQAEAEKNGILFAFSVLAFLDTDIAEPENACSVETLKLWEKSQSNLGIPACAKEISLV